MGLFITEEQVAEEMLSQLMEKQYEIIMFDDPTVNVTHVVTCLIKHCDHTIEQASQCVMIIESKGKYAVKRGPMKKLAPIYKVLTSNKLTCMLNDLK